MLLTVSILRLTLNVHRGWHFLAFAPKRAWKKHSPCSADWCAAGAGRLSEPRATALKTGYTDVVTESVAVLLCDAARYTSASCASSLLSVTVLFAREVRMFFGNCSKNNSLNKKHGLCPPSSAIMWSIISDGRESQRPGRERKQRALSVSDKQKVSRGDFPECWLLAGLWWLNSILCHPRLFPVRRTELWLERTIWPLVAPKTLAASEIQHLLTSQVSYLFCIRVTNVAFKLSKIQGVKIAAGDQNGRIYFSHFLRLNHTSTKLSNS